MNCLPVIEMEMRLAARRRWTYILRVLFAMAGSAACIVVLVLPRMAPTPQGQAMLIILSYLCLVFCLLAGGFLTADCVSLEKREGTLGLLFLTPLTGMDIVLGKLVCHGFQMFYSLCALFPAFFLPLLAGGVTWSEVGRVIIALALALLLGAGVGVFVSVLATESRRTMMSTLAALVFIAAVPMVYLLVRRVFLAPSTSLSGLPQLSPILMVFSAFEFSYSRPGGPALFWGSAIGCWLLSSLLVATAGLLLGTVFRRMGLRGAAPRQESFRSTVGTHVLENNPYEWSMLRSAREARSLGALMHILIMFFAVMLAASLFTTHWEEGFITAFFTALAIHVLAKLRFSIEATRQIHLDRQSGALELLLVTTFPGRAIVQGHQQALRALAQKPLFLLVGINLVLELCVLGAPGRLHMDEHATVMFTIFFIGGMLLACADFSALRWLGLWHAFRAGTHVKAALGAFRSTMLLPWIALALIFAVLSSAHFPANEFEAILCVWIICCLLYDFALIHSAGTRLDLGLHRLASEGR